jgi:Skp family chaperone for outer membrane proteins
VLNVRKTIAVATVLASLFVLTTSTQVTAQQPPPQQQVGTRVAVIDIPYIFKDHPRFKANIDQIKNEVTQFEATVRAEQERIRGMRNTLTTFDVGTPEYKRAEEQMAQGTSDLQVRMALKRKDFMEREAKAYYNAYREIEYHVQDFCTRNGFSLVLRFNQTEMNPLKLESIRQGVNRAVVYQRNLNITDLILQRLKQGSAPQATVGRPAIPRVNR